MVTTRCMRVWVLTGVVVGCMVIGSVWFVMWSAGDWHRVLDTVTYDGRCMEYFCATIRHYAAENGGRLPRNLGEVKQHLDRMPFSEGSKCQLRRMNYQYDPHAKGQEAVMTYYAWASGEQAVVWLTADGKVYVSMCRRLRTLRMSPPRRTHAFSH